MSQGYAALMRDAVAGQDPEKIRAMLWGPEWVQLGMDAFKTRLRDAERDAVRLYFEALGVVSGREAAMVAAFLAGAGVRDETEGRRFIALGKRAEGATDFDSYRLAKQIVREHIAADPAERRRVMQELFGVVDSAEVVPQGSAVALASPQSHANGTNGKSYEKS